MFHKFCLLLLLAGYAPLWMSCWWWWDWWDNMESSWLSYFCNCKNNTSSSIFLGQALISSLKNKEKMSKLWKWYKSPNLFGALNNNNKKKVYKFYFSQSTILDSSHIPSVTTWSIGPKHQGNTEINAPYMLNLLLCSLFCVYMDLLLYKIM